MLPQLAAAVVMASVAFSARADDSLARLVPADVGLFVELQRGQDLLLPLAEAQVWLTLAQLAGQPALPSDTNEWRRYVEQTVNMPPEEAIRTLFAQRVACAAPGPRRTQDAVVLCQPASNPHDLIARWQARPLPTSGRTPVYRMPNEVGLALRGDVLILGDAGAHSMFDRIVTHLDGSGTPSLASDPVYERLLGRLPPNPDGVLFARLARPTSATTSAPTQPASAPATRPGAAQLAGWPGLLRDSSSVLLALHREGRLLRFSAVGDGPTSAAPGDSTPAELVASLPERTLLAWAGPIDYQSLSHAVDALPEQSVLRVAYQLHERAGTLQRLTESLTPAACVAIGVVNPEKRRAPAPPLPALAVLAKSRAPDATATEWRSLLHYTLDIYKLLSLNVPGAPQVPPVETLRIADRDAECVDLSPLVAAEAAATALGEVHLCWALDGDVLVIASHSDWLRQILAARQGSAPRLAGLLALGQREPAPQRGTIFVTQPGPIADLGALWLRYFEQTAPAILDEKWWRDYQPGGRVRLGIQVSVDGERQRLRVRSVTPGMPADGLLRPGDEIVGCNGRRFATSRPVAELHRGLAHRPNAAWFELWIERDQSARPCRIPLPFVDPVQILRRIVAVGRIVQRVVYCDDVADAEGPRGHLAVELRGQEGPLFAFSLSPTSAPTSAPAATVPVATAPVTTAPVTADPPPPPPAAPPE